MSPEDVQNWESLVSDSLKQPKPEPIVVEREGLEETVQELSKIIYATERRYEDTADRLVYEHREQFRKDLIDMNNIRLRLNRMLRDAV